MRSEHKTTGDEWDAFTRWRHVLTWRPGERKKIKQLSHRKDRRRARLQALWDAEDQVGRLGDDDA